MNTYLFYDIETTGLNKSFDQILQFAAIRTDLELNELDRMELTIKLNADIIPSPQAIIVHHIGIQDMQAGLSEYDAIKMIHQWINHPGTISLGYNTLGFDDEFLRFSFYRNLLTPYTHQFANQCGRMDLLPMVVMYYLFKQSILTWPEYNGKISLKLEHLNRANQWVQGPAHNAMVDVEATLALARVLIKEKLLWDYLKSYFDKTLAESRIEKLKKTGGLLINAKLGADNYYQCPVLFLGQHYHYKNQQLWLRLDTPNLILTNPTDIPATAWIINKKLGEPNFILPYHSRFLLHLTAERQQLAAANRRWLERNPEIVKSIYHHYADFTYPTHPETDVEARLYMNGFWSAAELNFARSFHQTKEKSRLLNELIHSPIQSLALRLIGRHYPDYLSEKHLAAFHSYLKKINPSTPEESLIDFQGNRRLTPIQALHDLHELRKNTSLTDKQCQLLAEFENYLSDHFNCVMIQ